MKKQDINISSLVDMIERGVLQLPEIQRRFVWQASRVRDLLDSLYRNYPTGSILVWETNADVPTRELQTHGSPTRQEPTLLLLDGQQRLTSLAAVIKGKPINVRGRTRAIDILFNLDHPEQLDELTEVEGDEDSPFDDEDEDSIIPEEEEIVHGENIHSMLQKRTFVVTSRAMEQLPNWVSVTEVFKQTSDTPFLRKAGVESLSDARYDKYTQRLQRLRMICQYPYVMHILERTYDYQEVAEIFVRVNSLGAKLRSSDLALAQISSKWKGYLTQLEKFQEECERSWFTLDLGLLVRANVVFAT